jgi:hypothetical protein
MTAIAMTVINADGTYLLMILIFFLISEAEYKLRAIFINVPLYVVGFTAIALMFQGLILGYIIAIGAFLVLSAAMGSGGGETKPLTQTEQWAKAEREERERHYLWNLYNKKD